MKRIFFAFTVFVALCMSITWNFARRELVEIQKTPVEKPLINANPKNELTRKGMGIG